MATTFSYAPIDRTYSWESMFNSVNANFQGLDSFLSNVADIATYIEKHRARDAQTLFTLHSSYTVGLNTLAVYKNGLRQWVSTDYTEVDSSSFEFFEECKEGDYIVAVITSLGAVNNRVNATVEPIVAMQGQQTFYLEKTYIPNTQSVKVYKNGVLQESGTDYTETSQRVITMTEPCNYNDNIVVIANITLSSPIGTISEMHGATESSNGTPGLVPMPEYGNVTQKFLRADGIWTNPPIFQGTDGTAIGVKGLVPRPRMEDTNKFLNSAGGWKYIQEVFKEAEDSEILKSSGRDSALVKRTTYSSTNYSPILSQKSQTGSWEVATSGDLLNFNYISDADYSNNTGNVTYQLQISPTEQKIKGVITRAEYADQLAQTIQLNVSGDASGSVSINGLSSVDLNLDINKLTNPVSIGLTGDVLGAVSFDGSQDVSINTSIPTGNETTAGKVKLYSSTGNNSDGTMTQAAITSVLSAAYQFKGSVENYYSLPSIGNMPGDVYCIQNANLENNISAGDSVAWNGTGWSKLAGFTNLSNYLKLDDPYIESVSYNNNQLTVTPSSGEPLSINLKNDYTLPAATGSTLGGIKVGQYLSINANGVLSANYPVAVYNNTTGARTNGLMSWEDKKKLDSIDPNLIVKEITSVNGIQIGNMTVDSDGVITLTKQNIIDALGYTPVSQDELSSMSNYSIENIVSSVALGGSSSINPVDNSIKLYSTTGTNSDGTLTQSALTDIISALEARIAELENDSDSLTVTLTDNYYKMSDIFTNYSEMSRITKRLDIENLTTAQDMFKGCTNLYDITPMDTSEIADMRGMFEGCTKLPARFPFVIDGTSITNADYLTDMFKNSSVTYVAFKNLNNTIKSSITSVALKGDTSLIVEFRN